jgi:TetR/AcrR family transcriptional regulator, cholesterol catabolism regulator
MGRPRLSQTESARDGAYPRREEILDVAVRLFSQKGYRATKLSDVADSLRFTRAALYYYFKNKSEILIALVGAAGDQLTAALADTLADQQLGAVEKLRRILRSHTLAFIRQPQLFTVFRAELAELPSSVRRDLIKAEDAYIHAIAALVESAMKLRLFKRRPAIPATLAIMGMANSVAAWYRPKGGLSPEDTADLIVDLCLDGLIERG